MIERVHQWWWRAGQLAALAGIALLGLVDLHYRSLIVLHGHAGLAVAGLHVGVAIAAAGVWLWPHRQGSGRLAVAAAMVVMTSLTISAARISLELTDGWSGRVDLRTAVGFWGLAESAGLLGVIFVVARRAAALPAVCTVAAAVVAVAVLPLRVGTNSPHQLVAMAYALLAVVIAAAGMYLRLAATARDRHLATVRAEQRAEFARDLHDFIAHHVTGIVVQAQGARYIVGQDPARAEAALAQIEQAGAETMTAMRRMVSMLRAAPEPGEAADAPTTPLAGASDLAKLTGDFTTAGPVPARLHVGGDLDDLPVDVTSTAYRVVMEALTNVRQHATGAHRVDVRLARTREWLMIRVSDDGATRAPRPRDRTGFGLAGLTERVNLLGGRLTAGPGIDGGWTVDVALPLAERSGE